MKIITVLLASAALASAVRVNHQKHAHRHADMHRRAADVIEYVPGPEVIVYELDGKVISAADVEKGLADGSYVLITQAGVAQLAVSTSTVKSSSTYSPAAFYKVTTSSSTSVAPTPTTPTSTYVAPTTSSSTSTKPTSTYVAPTSSTTPVAAKSSSSVVPVAASSSKASSSSSSSSSSGSGLNSDFPSGTISCSNFPSSYGPVAQDYLGLGGWTGVQKTPSYSTVDTVISYIETATSGGCVKNSFCSYACPPGYQKSQWPTAQGSTGQSIGGLYCNANGMLELSNPSFSKLCIAGTGATYVKNSLAKVVSVCRTDYPGSESETVPIELAAGSTESLTCPDAGTYYTWKGSATSAQYYVNPSGYGKEDACKWGSSGTNLGNWAPVNLGVGKSTAGSTFISMFQNSPTNTNGCLDFSIAITGDVSVKCTYKNCKFYADGVESSSGCTTAVTGTATYEFS